MNESPETRYTAQEETAELRRQLEYFRSRSSDLAATLVRTDARASAMRQELEQKRRGFSLLAKIMTTVGAEDRLEIFRMLSVEINPSLNMQRTAVLMPTTPLGQFRAAILQGYSRGQAEAIRHRASFRVPPRVLRHDAPVLQTREYDDENLQGFCDWLALPYFVSMPVVVDGEVEAVLVAGRTRERHPFMPPLGAGDAETMSAIAAFVASVLLQRHVAEMEHMAYHDPLTGLANSRLGRKRLTQAIDQARQQEAMVSVLYIDLDGFKAVNDRLGHAAGDAALRVVAQRMQSCVRAMDTVARFGGDEFIVVLPGDREGGERTAQSILDALAVDIDCGEGMVHVGASIGVAQFPADGEAADTLIKLADQSMYGAKRRAPDYRQPDRRKADHG